MGTFEQIKQDITFRRGRRPSGTLADVPGTRPLHGPLAALDIVRPSLATRIPGNAPPRQPPARPAAASRPLARGQRRGRPPALLLDLPRVVSVAGGALPVQVDLSRVVSVAGGVLLVLLDVSRVIGVWGGLLRCSSTSQALPASRSTARVAGIAGGLLRCSPTSRASAAGSALPVLLDVLRVVGVCVAGGVLLVLLDVSRVTGVAGGLLRCTSTSHALPSSWAASCAAPVLVFDLLDLSCVVGVWGDVLLCSSNFRAVGVVGGLLGCSSTSRASPALRAAFSLGYSTSRALPVSRATTSSARRPPALSMSWAASCADPRSPARCQRSSRSALRPPARRWRRGRPPALPLDLPRIFSVVGGVLPVLLDLLRVAGVRADVGVARIAPPMLLHLPLPPGRSLNLPPVVSIAAHPGLASAALFPPPHPPADAS
ncbi:hypothetical protein GGF50DRAFT_120884 [Schizophyllum commune]